MSTILEQLEYGFDRNSRRAWRCRSLTSGEDNAYAYDGLSQVVSGARGNLNQNATAIGAVPAQCESWDYDPTGNWRGYHIAENGAVILDQSRVHDKGNRLTQIGGDPNPVLLDRAGRMTEVSPDASGDWNESQKIKWDAWGRITEIRKASDDTVLGTYTYDGLTRRTTRTVEGTTTHCYYSDQWRPLEERKGSETTPSLQYYWGARHRDDLVRRDRATTDGGSLDETRYVLMDYFSPAAIIDATGTVTERYDFSAFGIRRILTPDFSPRSVSECNFEFAFQGQFLDSESGFLDYGYRYYSPRVGRWLSKDPLAFSIFFGREGTRAEIDASSLSPEELRSLYEFIGNCPVNFVDNLGLEVSWSVEKVCAPFPPVSTRFIQVVYLDLILYSDRWVDDGLFYATGDWDGGLYPNAKNKQPSQGNGLFVDSPEGLGVLANYEVCKVCVCDNLVSAGGITLGHRVKSIGPCIKWNGSMSPLRNFNLGTLPQTAKPSSLFLLTVNQNYPDLLPVVQPND